MHPSRRAAILAAALALTAPAAAAAPPPTAVLIAGDDSLPVFDAATAAFATLLPPATKTTRLSTSPALAAQPGIALATLPHVLAAIAALRPAPGQSCLVFATSHGAHHAGLWLSHNDQYLSPAALDRALAAGCAQAPTIVIISSCYSGDFARPPMARPNRIILTAARADRSSFGCGAGRTYTVYDQCLLAALAHPAPWRQIYATTKTCVRTQEERDDETPSLPQAWFGPAIADSLSR